MGIFSSKTATDVPSPTVELVEKMASSDKVVIFSKSQCPFCKFAKEIFEKLQEKYTAIELDQRDDAEGIQEILGEMTGAKTVPRVFIDGKCLGGGADIQALFDNGKLLKYFE